MSRKWPTLEKPPIILAIFQVKFKKDMGGDISRMISNDHDIKMKFPLREHNIHSNLGIDGTPAPGISTLTAKADTKITAYIYFTENKRKKLIVQGNSITFVNEEEYTKWADFLNEIKWCLEIFNSQLEESVIERTSLRFVNKFNIPDFNDPLDYFSQAISTDTDEIYPINKFSHRILYKIPDKETTAIVNQAIEPIEENNVYYYLDVDALDHEKYSFDKNNTIRKVCDLRDVKNNIFFKTVKQKTIDLCV